MTPPPNEIPSLLAGRYEIERELGRGASAFVYLARDRKNGRRVAVKVLRPELAESVGAERFIREIHVTASLTHPRIVSVLDHGEDEGRLFLVVPYLDGGTLRERLTRERQLPIVDAVAITHAMATALAYAHGQGLVHRDVKPENILFAGDEPCLADFGIARVLGDAVGGLTTSTGIVRGTPAYMSPEQASGERAYDGRSDVYSLGCVLYEMLAGVLPFQGATAQAIIAQRFRYAPEPLGRYRPTVPDALNAVVSEALAAAPADRFQSARAFAEALARAGLAYSTGGSTAPTGGGMTDGRLPGTTTEENGKTPPVKRWPRYALRALSAVAGVAIVWFAMGGRARLPNMGGPAVALDTTLVLVLPTQYGPGTLPMVKIDDVLYGALDDLGGVTPVDRFTVADALARDSTQVDHARGARDFAARFNAGRFLRSRVDRVGDSLSVSASLYDVGSDRTLSQATRRVSASDMRNGAPKAFLDLTSALLIRGPSLSGSVLGTDALPAMQAMANAAVALEEWDLPRADSSLEIAKSYDASSSRIAYWLAQVKAWRAIPQAKWRDLAQRGAADTTQLAPPERLLAVALSGVAREEYQSACRVYSQLRTARPSAFEGWYGLAQCNDLDHAVLPDSSSPSGWRFRSSYWQAMLAYEGALIRLPAAHHALQQDGFEALRNKFFTSSVRMRYGVPITSPGAEPSRERFLARPAVAGDTLVFVPVPERTMRAAGPGTSPATLTLAVRRGRRAVRRIAEAWAAALPRNIDVKEALAISLELAGDPAAADTLRAARRLSKDRFRYLQLAQSEVFLRVKFAVPERPADLRSAGQLADSVIAMTGATAKEAALAAPVAALLGKCSDAIALTRRGGAKWAANGAVVISSALSNELTALGVSSALGCPSVVGAPSLEAIWEQLPGRGATRDSLAAALLGRSLSLQSVPDSALVIRLAQVSGDYLLQARTSVLQGDLARARATLRRVADERRSAGDAAATLDAALSESRLWLQLTDTTSAEQTLDAALLDIRELAPGALADPVIAGCLLRAALLRREVAWRRHALDEWRRWDAVAGGLSSTRPMPG